jgi:hypothetical protein
MSPERSGPGALRGAAEADRIDGDRHRLNTALARAKVTPREIFCCSRGIVDRVSASASESVRTTHPDAFSDRGEP